MTDSSAAAQRSAVIAVSGSIPATLDDDIAGGTRPRADYRVLAEHLSGELLDYDTAISSLGRTGRVLSRIFGKNVALAVALHRRGRHVTDVFTDGEQVGLPYAALSRFRRKRPRHHMIVHIMSVPKKTLLFRTLKLRPLIDNYFVYASRQVNALRELGVEERRIHLTSFMVDSRFFASTEIEVARRRMICSAGLEQRDYETLLAAVDGLDVDVVLAAASPWSRRRSTVDERAIPANVTVCRLDFVELRRLYAEAAFVVMPLLDVEFQAGVTTILEAMAMERAVICTRTIGQTDVIVDGDTGVYVPPGDVAALRAAIVRLLEDPDEADRLGSAARRYTTIVADIDVYAQRLAEIITSVG
ncbi:glycosyltransferase family 4 protein [Ilumatobacter coccineus]|uniref:Putative glycosyltransferase n=1 Tax=Ilumatobacter coccineus (strain NBRC 103263 / KCTC 29153 / YM16-304) TaxID=1313172 RepID=A0A6C7E5E8_ILUCY|nr:glycosyltransferase family 4 protein [Ilumatobacter coccineus]BAN01770.1 putative glycosyltransferase [Ilumatobacter coccineus YM16-304]